MKKKSVLVLLVFAFLFAQCSILHTLVNLSRVKFKLGNISNVYVEGISVMNKNKVTDFSAMEALSLTRAIAQGSLRVTMVVNVDALNPNDGKGGYPATNARITSFPWRLVVDGKEFVSGNIASPFDVPGTGQQVTVPLAVSMDLLKNVQDRGFQNVVNIILRIAGLGKGTGNIALYAKPVIGTALGNISYPSEIRIISETFN